jgi:hypothetical protein
MKNSFVTLVMALGLVATANTPSMSGNPVFGEDRFRIPAIIK